MNFVATATGTITAIVLATAVLPSAAKQGGASAPRPLRAVEPVTAVLNAFETHQLVGLSPGPHGVEQGHAFLTALIRDPRFAARVNDIVVEFGAGFYQEVLDRYLLRGESVPDSALQGVWRDTFRIDADAPVYEGFYREVRQINMTLPPDRRLRVLLGDPPISWDSVTTRAEFIAASNNRDAYPAVLVEREVLAKNRRALLVYGSGHLQRVWDTTLVGRVERATGTRVFTISAPFTAAMDLDRFDGAVAAWPRPSLAMLKDTPLGRMHWTVFDPGIPSSDPRVPQATLEEVYDAVLHLGPVSSMTASPLDPALCADAAYMSVRDRRGAIQTGGSYAQLKAYCAKVAGIAPPSGVP